MVVTLSTMLRWVALAIYLVQAECAMEGYIVGGSQAAITRHPYSAYMNVNCKWANGKEMTWICGASIINQKILLTAAHCVANCVRSSRIIASVGSEKKEEGVVSQATSFMTHEDYNQGTSYADIGMLKIDWYLKLNYKISRVALMRKPPLNEVAVVAGWGLVDESKTVGSPLLKYINQTVRNRKDCLRMIRQVPHGCFCASSNKQNDYASSGDSGSALIVRGFIQIGIVSHKMPETARNVIVYTDVSYYYNWINDNLKRLYCTK